MSTKTGRRNLRHARIGEAPSSGRRAFTRDRITTRLLCVEFELPGQPEDQDQEPIELFFKPIPASVVMRLQKVRGEGEAAFALMLDILATYVVDPETGQSVASAEEWDAFGIDGIQAAIQAMVDGSRGGSGEGQGPMSAGSQDAMYQAAREMMQGDPAMAEAFRRAAEETAGEASAEEAGPSTRTDEKAEGGEHGETAAGEVEEMHRALLTEEEVGLLTMAHLEPRPNGTSDETLSSDSPSSSTDT